MPRKGENIRKRKDGRWEARYEKSRDQNGRIQYGYVYAHLKIKIFCIYLDILSEPWVTMEEDHQENEGLCHPCAVEFQ